MASRSRLHMATKTCTVKRPILSIATGATTWPGGEITGIPCTPLMMRGTGLFTAGRVQAAGLADTIQHEVYLFDTYDIAKGDVLTLDGVEYPIWETNMVDVSEPFMVVILSDVQAPTPSEAEFIR
jgi:hypothetical protein